MPAADVDEYLAGVDEPKRATLEVVRASILRAAPDAVEVISYGMPAFRIDVAGSSGKAKPKPKVIAGFAAFRNHLAYLPHSSNVFPALVDDLAGYTVTKGSLHFPVDEPLPDALVARLVATRRAEVGG